jgi:hypothetical protein
VFFEELDAHASASQCVDNPAQIIQVPREPVHAMHDNRVAGTRKAHQQFQLRTVRIFP